MRTHLTSVAAALCILATGGGAAVAGSLAYSGSLQYATGSYTLEERSTSLYLFNALRWTSGRWAVQASLPFVLQSPPAGQAMAAAAGVGDAFLRAERQVVGPRGGRPSLRLLVETKAPLSRMNPDFGTGEWDFGGGVSLAQRIGGSFVFADATYWKFGDPPGIELRDAVAWGLAAGRPLGRLGLLASVTGYTTLVAGIDPPVQAGLFLSWWGARRRSISVGAAFGLTESAPDASLSLGWRVGR